MEVLFHFLSLLVSLVVAYPLPSFVVAILLFLLIAHRGREAKTEKSFIPCRECRRQEVPTRLYRYRTRFAHKINSLCDVCAYRLRAQPLEEDEE